MRSNGSRDNPGILMIIGGGEDRTDHKEILQSFIDLAGGPGAPLAVLTAASEVPDEVWQMYRDAFGELGVTDLAHVSITEREQARDPARLRKVAAARGVFMTGGSQSRLVSLIGETPLHEALRGGYGEHGVCLAGTSAGASGFCTHMIVEGTADDSPVKGAARLEAGLGFINQVVIDQHFSQRHRISRLLSVVAQSPFLIGAGIDEDTALILHGTQSIEVIGQGCVTILDCRNAHSNVTEIEPGNLPQLSNALLHLLPTGSKCRMSNESEPHGPITEFIQYLTDRPRTA